MAEHQEWHRFQRECDSVEKDFEECTAELFAFGSALASPSVIEELAAAGERLTKACWEILDFL